MVKNITRLITKKAPIDNRFPHLRDTKTIAAHVHRKKARGKLFAAEFNANRETEKNKCRSVFIL
jgi:hypothetical protein